MVRRNSAMSSNADSPSRRVTVVDVYDLASAIGKDFEHLIEQYGTESVTILMPKVISSLEMLEAFASRNERENEEIITLRKAVDRLEVEKKETKELRTKFEKELEQIEDNYKSEIKELWDVVQKLQEENKKLSGALETKDQSPTSTLTEADLKVMLKLKDTVEKQRDQLRAIEKENEERAGEMDALQQSIEKINRINKELLRKNRAVQGQGRILVEEKADLIAQIQAKERFIDDLRSQLTDAERAKRDLEQSKVEETAEMDRENTPRFTLAELREVLQEKNTLKARVMELEEELEQLRPPPPTPSPQPEQDDDLPVQGPMPREPEDKLFPWRARKDSGVRKLFVNLVSKPLKASIDLSPTFELARSAACSSRASSGSSSAIVDPDLLSPQDGAAVGAYLREGVLARSVDRSLGPIRAANEPTLGMDDNCCNLSLSRNAYVYMDPLMISNDPGLPVPYQQSSDPSQLYDHSLDPSLDMAGAGRGSHQSGVTGHHRNSLPPSLFLATPTQSIGDSFTGKNVQSPSVDPGFPQASQQQHGGKISALPILSSLFASGQRRFGAWASYEAESLVDENPFPLRRTRSTNQRRPSFLQAKVSKFFNTVVALDRNSGETRDKSLYYEF